MDQYPTKTFSPYHLGVTQQADLWHYVLKQKKVAMENLLKAQKILESLQEVFAHRISVETIEGTHARFLSGITPTTSPEARYLLTVGCLNIHPFPPPPLILSFPTLAQTRSAHGDSTALPTGHASPTPSHALVPTRSPSQDGC